MSKEKKAKTIHVDNLIIHAQNVEFMNEQQHEKESGSQSRDPFQFFWGRRSARQVDVQMKESEKD